MPGRLYRSKAVSFKISIELLGVKAFRLNSFDIEDSKPFELIIEVDNRGRVNRRLTKIKSELFLRKILSIFIVNHTINFEHTSGVIY